MADEKQKQEPGPFWPSVGAALILSLGLVSLVISFALGEFSIVSFLTLGGGLFVANLARQRIRQRRQSLAVATGQDKDPIRAELKRTALGVSVVLVVGVSVSTYAWLDIKQDDALGEARVDAYDAGRRIGQSYCDLVGDRRIPEIVSGLEDANGLVLIVRTGDGQQGDIPNSIARDQSYIDAIELAGEPVGVQVLLCLAAELPESGAPLICESGLSDFATYELSPTEITITAHSLVGQGEGSASVTKQESCPTDDLPNWQSGANIASELTEMEWIDLANQAISSMN